jgi:ubiquinone biosynthesis monooxygenase Coq6
MMRRAIASRGRTSRLVSSALTTTSSSFSSSSTADVVIVGGGVAGAALACALKAKPETSALRVVVVDANDARSDADALLGRGGKTTDGGPPDARCVALTPRSRGFLERECGDAWGAIASSGRARAFESMQVWDGVGGGHVGYDASEVGAKSLGHVVENKVVLAALEDKFASLGVERVGRSKVEALSLPDEDSPGSPARVTIADATTGEDARGCDGKASTSTTGRGREIEARLVVAADGPKSATRKMAGVTVGGWGYGQRAVVGTVKTEEAHSTAWQRFLPTGPIALLPIGDGTWSNVVWTTTPSEAQRLTEVSDEEFAREVQDALQGYGAYKSPYQEDLNRFAALRFAEDAVNQTVKPLARVARSTLHRAVGVPPIEPTDEDFTLDYAPRFRYPPDVLPAGERAQRGSFPLSTHHAMRLTSRRLALIGDAAHVVHPLGGQGLNLGLRDAELLAQALTEARAHGQDIGSLNALKPYARASVAANAPMMAALDGLQKLFSTDAYPVALARSLGLAAVNAAPPVRKTITWYAMGAA